MNILKNTLKVIAVCGLVTFFSCEDDFSSVGGDVIGENDFVTEPYDAVDITAYSKKITAVQTSGLPEYMLGTYYDPVYGLSQASILSQLTLSDLDPDFGNNPVLDSVVMVIPLHSTVVGQEGEAKKYELDSIYGAGSMHLSVYESQYFLRDLDPNSGFEQQQLYYSNQKTEFENHLGALLFQGDVFFQKNEVVVPSEEDTLRLSPRLRIHLDKSYFQTKIIDNQGTQAFVSNSNFKSFFRGLYLKATSSQNSGSMAAIKIAGSKVILYYTQTVTNDEGNAEQVQASYQLLFSGNTVNVYDNNFLVDLSTQDMAQGESNLYLKGGEGSMVVVDLFTGPDSDGDGASDQLENLRQKNWLINEANLTFVVNENKVAEGEKEPLRVFVYDLSDNETLVDYRNDITASEDTPLYSRLIHLGRLKIDENGNRYYKIRLTDHIRYVLNEDSTNVKLGLVVAANVNINTFLELKGGTTGVQLPTTSAVTPEGTVLYGNTAADDAKKLKLRIYYTEVD